MKQFLKNEIYNHDEAIVTKILKLWKDIEEIRVAEKNLNDSKEKVELEGQRLMKEIACRKAAPPTFYHYPSENEENKKNEEKKCEKMKGKKKRSEEGEKEEKKDEEKESEEKRGEEKESEEEGGKERKEEEEKNSGEKRGRGRPKKRRSYPRLVRYKK
uniref:Uncharacterized protein n=1 Tax=Strongyloides venezuelensis TaxID=75913 RepID=A0A0K0FBC8_STRVS